MTSWIWKAAAQGAVAMLPRAERVNQLVQRHVTHSLELDDETAIVKASRVARHLANREAVAGARSLESLTVVELGTGWFPVAAVALAVAGCRRVITVDNTPHVRSEQARATVRHVVSLAERGRIAADPERLAHARDALRETPADLLLARLGIETVVHDARWLPLDGGSIDLVFSNNTLEHIPGPIIGDIFRELARVAAPGAVMSHWIDMGDHYANFDPSIGPLHFLGYSEAKWRLFNNRLQYQNRLRLPDYRELHAHEGWKIVREDVISASPEELHRIELADEFRHYLERDLLAYEAWIVSTR